MDPADDFPFLPLAGNYNPGRMSLVTPGEIDEFGKLKNFYARPVEDPIEIMAYVSRSRTRAMGAEDRQLGNQPLGWSPAVNLKTQYGFRGARYDHSGQFQRDIQDLYENKSSQQPWPKPLYRKLLEDLGMR
jgi:hypothetical protein